MKVSRSKQTKRQRRAICAAAASTAIVALEQHIHMTLSDPSTWTLPLHHKCGWAVLASFGWVAVELGQLATARWLEMLVVLREA